MEKFLAEDKVVKTVVSPQSVAAAKTGNRVKMTNAKRVTFLVDLGAGTSTDNHVFVLKQHDASTAGNSYDLEVAHPYYHKVDPAEVGTKVVVDTATATYDLHSVFGDSAGIVAFEILSEDLRTDCRWVSLDVEATNGTQIGHVMALVDHSYKPAYEQEV